MTRAGVRFWTAGAAGAALCRNQNQGVLVDAFSPTCFARPRRSRDAPVLDFRGGRGRWPAERTRRHAAVKTSCMVTSVGDTPPAHPDPLQPTPSDASDSSSAPMEELALFEQQSITGLPPVLTDPQRVVTPNEEGAMEGSHRESVNVSERSDLGGARMSMLPPSSSPSSPSSLSVWQGRWIVIGAAAIYGTNFAAIKLLDPVVPVAVSAALRFCLAAVAVTAAVVWNEAADKKSAAERDQVQQGRNGPAGAEWEPWWLGGEVGAWYCVGYLCQAWGLHYVDASKSAFFNALAVIVVPLLDSLFKRKGLGWTAFASIAMALGGVALLELGPGPDPAALTRVLPSSAAFDPSSILQVGDLLCLSQAIFFGIGYWRLEAASTKHPDESGPITAGQLLAIAGGSVAYWLVSAGSDPPSHAQLVQWLSDPFVLGAVAWTGLVSTALALWLETVALSVVSATELTILMTSVSLWGSLFAYLSMGETLSSVGMAGGVLILLGCVLTSLDKKGGASG